MDSAEHYPEHEKLAKISDKSQLVGEFLEEWCTTKGYTLCEWLDDADFSAVGGYFPVRKRTDAILADYFGIDLDKIEAEKRQMLDVMRKVNAK